jgi:cellulose biosynthesis protein BcsQ
MAKGENERFSKGSAFSSIAIISGKGGTGKTLIAASLGYLLSHCGFRTLLIDADLYTNGLTFFSLAEFPRRAQFSLYDIIEDPKIGVLEFISIPHIFCNHNLFILPSVSSRRKSLTELTLHGKIGLNDFLKVLRSVINLAIESFGIQYVIVDSRGGTDQTSIGAALSADGFITVTEADKTSWDVGKMLLDSIDDTSKNLHYTEKDSPEIRMILEKVERLGFLINKNVLPSQAIETFLKKEWECPHLSTIPLDENAIRFFQEDKIPVAEDIGCPFSSAVVPLVRKLFVSERWKNENLAELEELEFESIKANKKRKLNKETERITEKFASYMKIYGILMATGLLVTQVFRKETDVTLMFVFLMAFVLILLITISDPNFLKQILKVLSPERKPPKKNKRIS